MKPIESAYITCPGDRSVGIDSLSFTMEIWIDLGTLAEEERQSYLEGVRSMISELYSEIHDDQAHVLFDFECEESEE